MNVPELYQVHLFQEYYDLRDKTAKLALFIFSDTFNSLDPDEQERMSNQHTYMEHYLNTLYARILAIPSK